MSGLLGGNKPPTDNEACLVAAYYLKKAGADTTDTTIRTWLLDPPNDVEGREFVVRDITVESVAECARTLTSDGLLMSTNDPLLAIQSALQFYANPKSWVAERTGHIAVALQDHGAMARNALTLLAAFGEDADT